MDTKLTEALLNAIGDIVAADGPWTEKRDAILNNCNPDEMTNLQEFIAWFPEEDDKNQDNHNGDDDEDEEDEDEDEEEDDDD